MHYQQLFVRSDGILTCPFSALCKYSFRLIGCRPMVFFEACQRPISLILQSFHLQAQAFCKTAETFCLGSKMMSTAINLQCSQHVPAPVRPQLSQISLCCNWFGVQQSSVQVFCWVGADSCCFQHAPFMSRK